MILKSIPKIWTKELNIPFSVKSVNDVEGIFEGHASTWDLDLGGDRIERGAFADSIKEAGQEIPILWSHDPKLPIGVTEVLREDWKGLYVKGRLALEVPEAQRAMALLKMSTNALKMSIGYDTIDYKYEGQVRVLKTIKLWEISVVVFPMNPEATFDSIKNYRRKNELAELREFLNDLRTLNRRIETDRILDRIKDKLNRAG